MKKVKNSDCQQQSNVCDLKQQLRQGFNEILPLRIVTELISQ